MIRNRSRSRHDGRAVLARLLQDNAEIPKPMRALRAEAAEHVAKALAERKLTPGQKAWAEKQSPESLAEFLASAFADRAAQPMEE